MTNKGFVESREGHIIVGESVVYAHKWLEADSVTSPSAAVYFKGVDVTTTVMPAGTNSVSGNIQIAKPLVANSSHAGGKYVLEFTATVDGNTEIRKYQLDCIARGQEL